MEGKRVLSARRGFSFQVLNKLIAKAELSSLVMFLVAQGSALARRGEVDKAIEKWLFRNSRGGH